MSSRFPKNQFAICLLSILITTQSAYGFISNGRWSSTATDNPTALIGSPITLTWSIVPDGTSIPSISMLSDFIGDFDNIYGENGLGSLEQRSWFSLIQQSFDRWEEVSGVNFVYEPNDDGLPVGSFAGSLGVRGDIRIGGATIDGNGGTLAQIGFIPFSDITFDTSDTTRWNNMSQNSFNFRHTLMHELGHAIGLDHSESFNASILMEPFASFGFEGPQVDDIRGAHRLYGDSLERLSPNGNNRAVDATPLGVITGGTNILVGGDTPSNNLPLTLNDTDFVSLSNIIDVDYFSFEVSDPISLSVTLEPEGPVYSTRANSSQSYTTIDSSSSANLVLELYQVDGETETLIETATATGIGESESLSEITLADAGTYAVKVSSLTNAIQLYSLELTADSILAGDYNDDGQVDAADYTVWRDSLQSNDSLANETASLGVADLQDYQVWVSQYGLAQSTASAFTIPEPHTLVLLGGFVTLALLVRHD